MAEYDLSDPYDLDMMHHLFDQLSEEEWGDYIERATEKKMGYKNINILKTAQRKARLSKYLSDKVIRWILSVVEELDAENEDK
ncbi:MAG: hypothetical protein D8M58_16470 [Calditrichaeota bacterium]|nr:MAG: hypothetical protein DWQ03_08200 [Calditrichota bacterium]MBL1207001.1 hypothetical protein [Calditrichota bacterium]NOG46828.1 hypothetical protein [Calditrichota bacterium]